MSHVLMKELSIAKVNTKIGTAVNKSLLKQHKVLFLRRQLTAINAELQCLELANTGLHCMGILPRTRTILMYSFVESTYSPQVLKFAELLRLRNAA